jgi:hypothetical protein
VQSFFALAISKIPTFRPPGFYGSIARIRMRVLIRNPETLKFVKADGTWTVDPAEAMAFPDSWEAYCHRRDRGISNGEIVIQFGPDEFTVLDAAPGGPPR